MRMLESSRFVREVELLRAPPLSLSGAPSPSAPRLRLLRPPSSGSAEPSPALGVLVALRDPLRSLREASLEPERRARHAPQCA